MGNYDFFTPIALTKSLLSLLPPACIRSITDICCGQGNMLIAAGKKYPNAEIEGVDIKHTPTPDCIKHAVFHNSDGRDFAIQCFRQDKTFDLILLNPPFGYLGKNEQKLKCATLKAKTYHGLFISRYEYEMLQAALLLTHDDSYIILILPSTFIIGESLFNARREIAQDYSVCAIVDLPGDTFFPTKVNTVAVILKKEPRRESKATALYRITDTDSWTLNRTGNVSFSSVCAGDWRLHYSRNPREDQVAQAIHRGALSSSQFTQEGSPVLHCAAKKSVPWTPSIRYYDPEHINRNIVFANRNDVIINRIGKAAGYWYINQKDTIPISDCLFVLRNPSVETLQRLAVVSDSSGRLKVTLRGLSTQYTTIEDIKQILREDRSYG